MRHVSNHIILYEKVTKIQEVSAMSEKFSKSPSAMTGQDGNVWFSRFSKKKHYQKHFSGDTIELGHPWRTPLGEYVLPVVLFI